MFEISTIKRLVQAVKETFSETFYTKNIPFMSEGWIFTKTDLNVILSYEGYIKTLLEMFYHVFIYLFSN